ncbi:CCA tRNA nucleotidyltransferase [Candidatus Woesearchaeota archaeon]|nr:CCA tRNA nucleotidyltransferase [Candidatus Woesearchaeota archaeon]
MKEILISALKEIKPSKEEEKEVKDSVTSILNSINKNLKDAKAVLGGSGIKGTWLKKANDADIFVKFDYKKYKERSGEISDLLEKILKKRNFKITRLHGSRDYFQIKESSITLEIIPILDIKKSGEAENITDVSPLHANWVKKKGKNLEDDIRLLKQFCRSANVYGAESYIHGFSGYICEILTIYYKGFENVIRNAARWGDKVVIDAESHWKGKDVMMELNKSKTYSPLVIIDPVHAERNAAASISTEKFELFKEKAKRFLKGPSKDFFEMKELNEEMLKKKAKGNTLVLIDVMPKKGKEDVIGCKLIKALGFINKKLKENDFKVMDYGWKWNGKALFYFMIKKEELSGYIEREGPPLKAEQHVLNFKKKYGKTFIKEGRIYSKVKRRFRNPEELIKSLKKEDYLKEKISGFVMR